MKTVFLDLEKTIIHSWDDPVIINEVIVTERLTSIRPDLIGIYSFAIYDDRDRNYFLHSMKQEIEDSFHLKIETSLVFTVQEIANTILKAQVKDIQTFIQTHGKQNSFQEFIITKFKEGEFVLIDDLVENIEVSIDQLNLQFINPFSKTYSKLK